MFCKDCGAQLPDDDRFCPNCGSTKATTPPAEPADFAGKVRATAKKIGSSTAFLVATICLTFAQVLGLLMPAGNTFETFRDIFATGFFLDGQGWLTSLESLSPIMDIAAMLPGLLITLGLWITFFSCASRKAKANTSGLTIIFVVNLVQMVLSCLALLTALIPLVAIYAGEYKLLLHEDMIEAIALTVGLVLLIIFIFVLVYYIKICTTISNIRSTLKTGVPNKKVSRFVAILCYISGGILIMSGIGSLLSAGVMVLDGFYDGSVSYALQTDIFLSAISTLLTAAAQIIFGALIFTYRRKMAALEEEDRLATFQTLSYAEPYTAPVYIPPEPISEVINEPKPANEELEETKRWDC